MGILEEKVVTERLLYSRKCDRCPARSPYRHYLTMEKETEAAGWTQGFEGKYRVDFCPACSAAVRGPGEGPRLVGGV